MGPGGGRNSERSGGGPGGAPRKPRPERQLTRTVYVLSSTGDSKENPKLTPVQIKVGISDGATTEVLDGINEGTQVVTAILSSGESTRTPQANPFGGGFRRF